MEKYGRYDDAALPYTPMGAILGGKALFFVGCCRFFAEMLPMGCKDRTYAPMRAAWADNPRTRPFDGIRTPRATVFDRAP